MDPIPPYSLFADWLSKFHTWPEFIQALWLVAVPATLLGMTALLLRGVTEIVGALPAFRGERRGRLVYGVYENPDGRLLLYRDGAVTEAGLPPARHRPAAGAAQRSDLMSDGANPLSSPLWGGGGGGV